MRSGGARAPSKPLILHPCTQCTYRRCLTGRPTRPRPRPGPAPPPSRSGPRTDQCRNIADPAAAPPTDLSRRPHCRARGELAGQLLLNAARLLYRRTYWLRAARRTVAAAGPVLPTRRGGGWPHTTMLSVWYRQRRLKVATESAFT